MAILVNGQPVRAPNSGVFNGKQVSNPSEKTLLAAGYKYQINGLSPAPKKGGFWQAVWDETETEIIVADWEWIEVPMSLDEKIEALVVLALRDSGLEVDLDDIQVIDAISTLAWDRLNESITDGGEWAVGAKVIPGQVVRYGGKNYEVIQGHITQDGWSPDKISALFKFSLASGEPWKQPEGAHDAYQVGDVCTHKGNTWISTYANNVWEPGVYGWEVQISS